MCTVLVRGTSCKTGNINDYPLFFGSVRKVENELKDSLFVKSYGINLAQREEAAHLLRIRFQLIECFPKVLIISISS